jgi:nitrilase
MARSRAYCGLMAEFRTVRVAAVQATPVILDAAASVEKAVGLIGQAAADGAELVVLPETFVPLYPSGEWAKAAAGFGGFDEFWERLWSNSVEVPGPLVDELAEACAEHGVYCAIGVNERELERPGTIYNALLLIGPDGLLSKHRKLMPTHHEKLFHGVGGGGDLEAVDTRLGRIGGLICWENLMPLARYAVYRSGPQIWVAPTADDTEVWLASMRHVAIESGAFVVSVPQYIPRSAFPEDFPVELPDTEVFGRGGAAIIEPTRGELIAGPLYDQEGIVSADCDLRTGLHAKRWFDAVGHYSREDVLLREVAGDANTASPSVATADGRPSQVAPGSALRSDSERPGDR